LIHRLLVNAPFCYCKRLLHLRIYLLFPFILTPFWALFSLILPRDPNGKGQMQKHLLLAHRRRLLWSFFIVLHRCIYERKASPFFCIQDLTSSIDAGRLYVERKFCAN
jgi:hypothetical protein